MGAAEGKQQQQQQQQQQQTQGPWEEDKVVRDYLRGAAHVSPPPRATLQQVIDASNNFFIEFPIHTARLKTHVKNGKSTKVLEDHINSSYPLLHHRCLPLFAAFLHFKEKNGTKIEKDVYKEMSLLSFVDRLLKKRPASFLSAKDSYKLRDGRQGHGGFEEIGSLREHPPLCLEDYLSYDEMKLSALLSASSYSFFINDGDRRNKGVPGTPGSFLDSGVIVGMVGARLKREGCMEWQDCVITPKQNRTTRGYGASSGSQEHLIQLWAKMWGIALPLWSDTSPNKDLLEIKRDVFLNVRAYKARIQLTAETLLAEAKRRAIDAGLKAYIHVVGLGLGVWRLSHKQDELYIEAWGDAIKNSDVAKVAHIDFSWIGAEDCHGVKDGQTFPDTNVVLHFSRRSLHDPVPEGTLLVVCYAWDGNSLPGNEYWLSKLGSSGDSAAACSSGVAELHNVYINPNMCASNLHITGPWGVMHVSEYASRVIG